MESKISDSAVIEDTETEKRLVFGNTMQYLNNHIGNLPDLLIAWFIWTISKKLALMNGEQRNGGNKYGANYCDGTQSLLRKDVS